MDPKRRNPRRREAQKMHSLEELKKRSTEDVQLERSQEQKRCQKHSTKKQGTEALSEAQHKEAQKKKRCQKHRTKKTRKKKRCQTY